MLIKNPTNKTKTKDIINIRDFLKTESLHLCWLTFFVFFFFNFGMIRNCYIFYPWGGHFAITRKLHRGCKPYQASPMR